MRKLTLVLLLTSTVALSACSSAEPTVNNDNVKLPAPAVTLESPGSIAPGETPATLLPDPAAISLPQGATVQSVNDTCKRLNADVKAKSEAIDISMESSASFRESFTLVGDGFRDRSAGFKEQLALGGDPKVTADLQNLITASDKVSKTAYVLRDSADLMDSEDTADLSKFMELQGPANEAMDAYSAAVAASDFRACDAVS